MSELEIPDEVIRVACDAYDVALGREAAGYTGEREHAEVASVRAAAPLIVAAELRRLAALFEFSGGDLVEQRGVLNARAYELDPDRRTR